VARVASDHAGEGQLFEDQLIEKLRARDGVRVVPPDAMPKTLAVDSGARQIRQVAFERELDGVVFGRLTAAGMGHADLAGRTIGIVVRSGHSGGVVSEHQAGLPAANEIGETADKLAASIVNDLGWTEPTPLGVAAESARTDPSDDVGRARDAIFGLGDSSARAPIAIESEELEFFTLEDGSRKLLFRQDVRVVQGEVTLLADELEAFYPPQESQPERLVARGNVRVIQGDRSARCEEVLYQRSRQTLTCSGHAELSYGCDVVRGRSIVFDLASDRAKVVGAASVVIQPKGESGQRDCPEPSP
jgi:lipopolysaccharide export system protein LptA